MKTKKLVTASAAILLLACTGLASAGEVTGTGKSLKNEDGTLNGKSVCAYSGLEDHIADTGLISQSWGRITKAVRDFLTTVGAHPGDACNPQKSSGQEP